MESQDDLYISHLNKSLVRGDPDITQDIITMRRQKYNKADEYYIKKLEDLINKVNQ